MKLPIVLWKWGSKFSVEHVHRARNMLARHLNLPHEIVLITDKPAGIDKDIKIIPLWSDLREKGKCLVRLKVFHPSMQELIGPRFASMDLDVVLTDNVTPIFSRQEDFIISGVELRPQPYNGSLFMMNAGARAQVFSEFNEERWLKQRRLKNYGGSDQAWIAICLGEKEATWTVNDGIFTYRDHVHGATRMRRFGRRMEDGIAPTKGSLPKGCRIMVMNGRYDPSDKTCVSRSSWIQEHWV